MSDFGGAWEDYKKRRHILPLNEQAFRHGWNAALYAAARLAERGQEYNRDNKLLVEMQGVIGQADTAQMILRLEVEVET